MEISIIIPCYNEGRNVITVTDRIYAALSGLPLSYEILFVDDSSDDTTRFLDELSHRYSNVRYLHRTNTRGLGTAVVDGFNAAKADALIVMDCDLQHPPEVLPDVIHALKTNDVVIPTRFKDGGSDGGLNFFRKLVSWTARKIGQWTIRRLRFVSDCTSGFFGIHRAVISNVTLNPNSWKILMEVLVKGNYNTIAEPPYQFMARDLGNSKMSLKEQINYLWHIIKLVSVSPEDRRFYLFCLVGLLGLFLNLILFKVLIISGLHPLLSSIVASFTGAIHNFLWHDNVTWKGCKHHSPLKRLLQFPQFILISTIGIMITAVSVKCFLELGLNITLGQLVGIAVATFWNYFGNKKWTWRG